MRGVICYYSGSGNTRLACEYVARHLGLQCDLVDTITSRDVDLASYDFVGLAASTDFGSPPELFERFIAALPSRHGTPAFVLNTYGMASGRTLRDLAEQAHARGFTVVAAYSFPMPESYPPMMKIGLGFADRPKASAVRSLDAFIAELHDRLEACVQGEAAPLPRVRLGMMSGLAKHRDRTTARRDMGEKFVDASLCTRCGTCAERCPYGAIALAPTPMFDMERCFGCWRCYNGCPERAIYTHRFRGEPFYPRPSDHTREVLGS